MKNIPSDVEADIIKRYNAIKSEDLEDHVGQIECFTCQECGKITRTKVLNKGHLPKGIICPKCGGEAMSSDFVDIAEGQPIEYNWRKPSIETVLKCHNKPMWCQAYLSGMLERVKRYNYGKKNS